MEIGLIGLGRMGGNMVKRLGRDGHEVVAFDLDPDAVREAEDAGASGAGSLEELVDRLAPPRAVWIMVPHGEPTRKTISELLPLLESGDVVVDGGNSRWTDSMEAARRASEEGVHFLDAGVSGGVWGLEEGYCTMVGGSAAAVERLSPVFESLAPEDGWAHVGPSGAGHFVKMIHNAIEYAMLEALGEGFECLQRSEFELDLGQVADLWQHGAVIRSWLLELSSRAFEEEGNDLEKIRDWVDDSGTGRWTVEYATDNAIPAPAFATALFRRFRSRQEESFSAKAIAALRNQFGGHEVKEEE